MSNDKIYFLNLDFESDQRFDPARFLEYSNDGFDPLTSSMFNEVNGLKFQGYFIVQGEEHRPDTISFKLYGSTQYWWIIMLYNSLASVDKVVSGISLRYPTVAALEDFYFRLKSRQSAQEANS